MPEFENVSFEIREFESKALGDKNAQIGVFLPKGYADEANAEKKYPLLIWLHGMREDHRRFATRGGGAVLDKAIGEGDFPESVVICPNGEFSFWTDMVVKDSNYEQLVIDDLLEYAESELRIREEREQRAICGVSMGGYGALKIAFRHPEKFGVVAAHAAAVLPADVDGLFERFTWLRRAGRLIDGIYGNPIDEKRYRDNNLLVLAEKTDKKKLESLAIYFDAGDRDRYGFGETNAEFSAALKKRKVKHEWTLVKGGGHSWSSGFTQARLPTSLAFVAKQWTKKKALKGLGGMLDGDKGVEEKGGEKKKDG